MKPESVNERRAISTKHRPPTDNTGKMSDVASSFAHPGLASCKRAAWITTALPLLTLAHHVDQAMSAAWLSPSGLWDPQPPERPCALLRRRSWGTFSRNGPAAPRV